MGLLARKINILMTGERQLLDENKERSGDNRAIRQNRTHRKSEADKQVTPALPNGANAVKAEGDKTPWWAIGQMNITRVIDPTRREELSAQRRKKKFTMYGISGLSNDSVPFSEVPNSQISVTRPFQAIQSAFVRTLRTVYDAFGTATGTLSTATGVTTRTLQRTNEYKYVSKSLRIYFNSVKSEKRTTFNTLHHEEPGVVEQFDWTFHQSSMPLTYQVINGMVISNAQYASELAQLPLLEPHSREWFSDKKKLHATSSSTTLKPLITCDGRYIYYSSFFIIKTPAESMYRAGTLLSEGLSGSNGDNQIFNTGRVGEDYYRVQYPDVLFYDNPNTPSEPFIEQWGEYLTYRGVHPYLSAGNIYTPAVRDNWTLVSGSGIYWRFDTHTNTSELQSALLGQPTSTVFVSNIGIEVDYLNNLWDGDPMKTRWLAIKGTETSYGVLQSLANQFLSTSFNTGYRQFRIGLVYYPDTGEALYTANYIIINGTLAQTPRVYTRKLSPGMELPLVHQTALPSAAVNPEQFQLTHEQMISGQWEYQGEAKYPGSKLSGLFALRPS